MVADQGPQGENEGRGRPVPPPVHIPRLGVQHKTGQHLFTYIQGEHNGDGERNVTVNFSPLTHRPIKTRLAWWSPPVAAR